MIKSEYTKWEPPKKGKIKINTDATFNRKSGEGRLKDSGQR